MEEVVYFAEKTNGDYCEYLLGGHAPCKVMAHKFIYNEILLTAKNQKDGGWLETDKMPAL